MTTFVGKWRYRGVDGGPNTVHVEDLIGDFAETMTERQYAIRALRPPFNSLKWSDTPDPAEEETIAVTPDGVNVLATFSKRLYLRTERNGVNGLRVFHRVRQPVPGAPDEWVETYTDFDYEPHNKAAFESLKRWGIKGRNL